LYNTQDNKRLLNRFSKLFCSIEGKIQQQIENRISLNEHNETLIVIMEEAINFSKNNDKLKFQYCNFVTNYCIDKVNSEEIENYNALKLLANAYFISPKHQKLCTNLITLIHFNLRDIRNEEAHNMQHIYLLLDKICENRSSVFNELSHELLERRENLLSQCEQIGISRVILTGQSNGNLNSSGLVLKKVLRYYKKLGEN
jgi:hypothetical protein